MQLNFSRFGYPPLPHTSLFTLFSCLLLCIGLPTALASKQPPCRHHFGVYVLSHLSRIGLPH